MHAKHSRPQLNWVAASLIAATTLTSGGCAKLYHMLHYNSISSLVSEHHRPFYHSPKTGRIIVDEHRANCAVEPPCFGYEATCWHRWPEECGKCPQEEVVMDMPYNAVPSNVSEYVPVEATPAAPAASEAPSQPADGGFDSDPESADPSPSDEVRGERLRRLDISNRNLAASADANSLPEATRNVMPIESPITRSVTNLDLPVDLGLDAVEDAIVSDRETPPHNSLTNAISARRSPLDRTASRRAPKQLETASTTREENGVRPIVVPSKIAPAIVQTTPQEKASEQSIVAPTVEAAGLAANDTGKAIRELTTDASELATPFVETESHIDSLTERVADEPVLTIESRATKSLAVSAQYDDSLAPVINGRGRTVTDFSDMQVDIAKPEVQSFKIKPVLASKAAQPTVVTPLRLVEESKPSTVIRFASDSPVVERRVATQAEGGLRFR